jgi:hypothetical protein
LQDGQAELSAIVKLALRDETIRACLARLGALVRGPGWNQVGLAIVWLDASAAVFIQVPDAQAVRITFGVK